MLIRACLSLTLLVAVPAWSQVAPAATGGETNDAQMQTPPPVNGEAYPILTGDEMRTNYLRGGFSFNSAYIDNLYAGGGGSPISETTYSVLPTISFDQTTARQHRMFTYSPGFTFYQPSSELNEVDENAIISYQIRVSPHASVHAEDGFQDSSTAFGLAGFGNNGTVSGSPELSTPGITPPFAQRLTNTANVEYTVQTAQNIMIGASGLSTTLHYPNTAETTGLYDSSSRGGTVFYNHRISTRQYFGATYQYLDMLSYPANAVSTTQTQTIMGFYTFYVGPRLSLSVSGGPQYYYVNLTPLPTSSGWGPSVSTSMGWQGTHTSFAASYSQSVTGGGGLLGAFHNKAASVTARWKMSHTWTTGFSGAYFINKSVTPLVSTESQNGHSVSGTATLERSIGEQFRVSFNYDRLHQSYSGITAISSNPNSDRELVSITWQFARPLGR